MGSPQWQAIGRGITLAKTQWSGSGKEARKGAERLAARASVWQHRVKHSAVRPEAQS